MTVKAANDQLLIFERTINRETLRCVFNLSDKPVGYSAAGRVIIRTGTLDGGVLGAYSAVVEEIA